MKKIIISLAIFLLFIFDIIISQEKWNKEFTKEDITVYTRIVKDSPLKEFKGEGMVDASMEVCMNVLNDVENHVKWRPDCAEAKLLKEDGNVAVSYNHIKAPWPASDRDAVMKTIITITEDKAEYVFTAYDDQSIMPERKGIVRMKKIEGKWIFKRQGNKTYVVFQARIDPAGSIPAWLANRTSIDQPFESIKGLKKMVKDPKYAG